MDGKQKMIFVVMSVILAALAVTVTASALAGHTPLYTVRMEQASNKMHFLPTEMNGFTYTTEKGCTLECTVVRKYSDVTPLATLPYATMCITCEPDTCEATCGTCAGWTCDQTSCQQTCYTCEGQGHTCDQTSCQSTCSGNTCWSTCPYTCCTYKYCETTEPTCP